MWVPPPSHRVPPDVRARIDELLTQVDAELAGHRGRVRASRTLTATRRPPRSFRGRRHVRAAAG
ncbi:hypothetical protein CSX11_13700 [Mycobacterium goodii]|nr:hypothetical protein CSX11_13700 [Mycolicibacterium goodii]